MLEVWTSRGVALAIVVVDVESREEKMEVLEEISKTKAEAIVDRGTVRFRPHCFTHSVVTSTSVNFKILSLRPTSSIQHTGVAQPPTAMVSSFIASRSQPTNEVQPPKRKSGGSASQTATTKAAPRSKLAKEHNVSAQEEGEIKEAFSLFSEPMDGEKMGVIPIDDVKSALMYDYATQAEGSMANKDAEPSASPRRRNPN